MEDVNIAYNTFLSITTALYEKNCPQLKKVVEKKNAEKPWLTKGILNACKKTKQNYYIKNF